MKHKVIVGIIAAAVGAGFSFYQPDNEIPLVEITEPRNGVEIKINTDIPYKIKVTDKEDGSTEYEEISQGEVFLKVKYLPSEKHVAAYILLEKKSAEIFRNMTQHNCFTCHAVQQNIIGPSFRDVAAKYGASMATYEKLSSKIIEGSRGVWSDNQQMPAHPEITKEMAQGMAKWVVQYGSDTSFNLYTGTEGKITLHNTHIQSASSVLLLMAFYLDHGIQSDNRKEGISTTTINLR